MMRISFGSLRTRLILVVLLAVIPAFGLSLYSGLEQRHDALSRAQENALRMAGNASGVQERLIENTRQIFFALSQMPEVQNLNPAACSKILEGLQSQSKGYTMFFAVRPNGDLFASALPVSGRMAFTDRAWYQQVLKTREFVIGEYVIGRISGKAAVTLAYPVLDRKGEMKAILGTGLDLGWLSQFMAESKPPEGTTLYVIDRKGTILLRHPDPEKFIGKTMPEGSILKAILAKEEGVSEAIGLDGIPRLYGFTSLDRFAGSVYVSVGIPKEIAFAEATRDMRRNLIWLGIVGALAIIAAWLGSSLFIMRPVDRLLEATKRLAEGDLTVRTGPRYNRGEIGQLAFAFDQMADALAEKEAQIREYTGELERKVRERTRALQESEERFRIAAQSASDLIWEWDTVKGDLAWFGRIDEMLGYSSGEFPRSIEAWEKIIHPGDHDRVMTTLEQHLQTRKPYSEEYRVFKKDGSVLYWLDSGMGLWDEEGKAYKMIGAVSDITDRKKAEDRIRKLNHVYAMLSDINQAIVRIREPQALFKEACRVAVEKGDFPLAWIGLVDDSTKQFRVVASAGKSGGYFEKINISLEGDPLGYCPIDSALREGEQVICNVIEQNEDLAPCQKIAIGLGFRSSASFPLRVSGRIRGTFNFYAGEADFFDDEERKLLDELAIDISFATEFAEKEAERKRAEEALRRSEARFRELYDHAPVGYHEYNVEGRITNVNLTDLEMLGYTREEMIGLYIWEFNIEEGIVRQQVLEKLAGLRPPGQNLERTYRRKDGTTIPVLIEDRLILDEKGRITGIRCTIQDIAERRRTEEALQKSEEIARKLSVENAAMAEVGRIISSTLNIEKVHERLGDEVRKLIPFDRIVINHINTEKETVANAYIAGKGITDRKVGEIYPLKGSGNAEMVNTKSTFLLQTEDFNEYKDRFPMLLSTFQSGFRSILNVPLFSKGKIIGGLLLRSLKPYAYTDRDVRLAERVADQIAGAIANAQLYAERIQAEKEKAAIEEQFRQSQKMEAIGRLAGGIAHDFNNLLTIIQGYTQLSLLDTKEGEPLRANLQEVKNATDRASDLIRQILAFSRRQVLEFKVLDLNIVIRDLDKMLRRVIGEDIELLTLFADNLGRVRTDPGQIEQLIMNLAVNAKDAMPSGGNLTIETANVELDEEYAQRHVAVTPGRYVMLAMSDTGVGMNSEVKDKVFEPFFTTKEKGKGTGLGLSTVYGIVKQSGGNIWVYSEVGKGTTLKIYLPRVDDPLEEKKPVIERGELPRGNETILVVEDEEQVRRLAVRILRAQGYKVLEASQGDEALQASAEHKGPIHLLVTDVVMPRMNGRELAKHLESIRSGIMVLYTSGYTDNAIVHHGVLEEGMNYIQKPFSVEGLARKVREVLDK